MKGVHMSLPGLLGVIGNFGVNVKECAWLLNVGVMVMVMVKRYDGTQITVDLDLTGLRSRAAFAVR
ncbi:hypothetical protein E2C01_094452 [Portunus trituberculatus]|uniref:Uncharacterized protein n=1 Tax=Portunus trituberculatus TaxID=210409 RepID=A0A5B7K0R0_PORTR|nr:hypothetical protein [Portunus trituberculatus]